MLSLAALRRPLAGSSSLLRSSPARFQSSKAGSSKPTAASADESSSADPTSKEVLRAEAQSEAHQSLTTVRPPGEAVAAGVVSGAPPEILRRPVRIYQPALESTQSAKATSHHWRIDWDTTPGSGRWENALMGWASSADYVQGTHLKFNSKQQAINFAEKQGYPYFVQEPHNVKYVPKSYANNFLYTPGKIRYIRTK